MKLNKKLVTLFVLVFLLMIVAVGCGADDESDVSQEENKKESSSDSNSKNESANNEGEIVTIYEDAKRAEEKKVQEMYGAFTEETGIDVEIVIVPGNGTEMYNKIDVELVAGASTDVIRLSNPILIQKYSSNGWLTPLDEVMEEDNYDAESAYGDYLPKADDGKTYVIPYQSGKWAVFYNKKIFDDAGVDYPEGDWTWDEYVDIAKKLTDKDKGIYGSYMLDYDFYLYMLAKQYGISGYKEDGTSNYDHPKFKEALKFFGDLGNEHEVQPSWMEYKSKKLAFDGFMSGNYGMHFIGDWYSSLLVDKETYPHDWEVGIAKVPVPANGEGDNNFTVVAGHGINKNAEHPEAAYEFVKWMGENQYKYTGYTPPRVDLTDEQIEDHYKSFSEQTNGQITVEDIKNALVDDGLGLVDEKIIGPAANEYSEIILQEADLYLVGQKSLDETVQSIKERADKAIEEATKE